MYPPAICLNLQNRRQKTGEGPIEPVSSGIASFDRLIQGGKMRHDGLVRHGWIVERERADEEPIAGNSMGTCRLGRHEQHQAGHGVAYRYFTHRGPLATVRIIVYPPM
jgi:hypothetical protein